MQFLLFTAPMSHLSAIIFDYFFFQKADKYLQQLKSAFD